MRETKAQVGANRAWQWLSPQPIAPATTPTLSLSYAGLVAPVAPVLAALVAPAAYTGIHRDRVTVTLAAPAAASLGAQGEFGEAWLVTESGGYYPVRIARLAGTTVTLTEPLPRWPEGAGVLQWRRWKTTLTAVDVTGAERRNWTARVSYEASVSTDVPSWTRTDEGLLHVLRQPFDTGLTHEGLLAYYPTLSLLTPGRQESFAPQIERAERLLVNRLRIILRESALSPATEDECDGSALQAAHALLTASLLYAITDPERAEGMEAVALKRLGDEVASMWVDSDKDGDVDDGENPAATANVVAASTFFADRGTVLKYSRGMQH